MSWPADGLPRFVATEAITGGPVTLPGETSERDNNNPEAYVLDRAYCHAIVASHRSWPARSAEQQARKRAAELNAA